jgi:hypothetical protein
VLCGGLQVSGWQERAPRSVSRDYDAANVVIRATGHKSHGGDSNRNNIAQSNYNNFVLATGTSRPVGTQLSDLFISVKTTRNYHKWRLPVILKTWFQLAKDQVRFTSLHMSETRTGACVWLLYATLFSVHHRRARLWAGRPGFGSRISVFTTVSRPTLGPNQWVPGLFRRG